MPSVKAAPVPHRSYDADRRRVAADLSRLGRKRPGPRLALPFVKVEPDPVEAWPPGTCWMDTGTLGPLSSHPLKVKRLNDDGSTWWDHVAWMVPE